MNLKPTYTYRDGDSKAFVDGLRELANFLVLNSSIPVPRYPSVMLNVIADTDQDRRAAVARVAQMLKVPVREDEGCFHASRSFGPIEFQCWASTVAADAEWRARRSYDDSVQP